jgi:hypothetical protein
MDFHHNTSLRSILEDDSISLASRAHIRSCLGKGTRLWLVVKPFIYSFHIAHFTFALTLYYCHDLIQPSALSFLTYECGHGLDAFNMHLVFSHMNVDMGWMHLTCI